MKKLDVGETLSRTFSIFFRSLPKLLAIAIPVYSPYIAIQLLWPGDLNEFTKVREENPFASILSFFLGPIVTSAVVFEVLQRLRGESARIGECVAVGARRLFPVLAVNILSLLAIGLGMIFLFVPGLIFMVMLAVAIPVCVVERPGVFRSLERSFELTSGSRWPIFAVYLVFGMVSFLPLAVAVGIATLAAGRGAEWAPAVVTALTISLTILIACLQSVLSATIYHQLRTRKEGAASDDLVQVFA